MEWENAERVQKNREGQYRALIGGEWTVVDKAQKNASGQFRVMRGQPQHDELQLAKEPTAFDNFAGGFKSGLKGAAQGIGQAVGLTSRDDVASQREQDREVLDTTSGKIGNFLGTAAAYAPAAFIPGVNTVAGGALIGAGIGGLQPSVSDAETIGNIGLGAAGGGIGAKISQFLAARANRRASNAAAIKPTLDAKNKALSEAQQSGYVVPPQDANAGVGSQMLNAYSGKIKTEQKASVINQSVTNAKAARSIGLPEHEPITVDSIDAVRKQAGKSYDAVRSIGTVKTDKQFQNDLSGIVQKFQSAAKDFPELLNDDVTKIVNSVNKQQFNADSAIDAIKILREKGTAAYRAGNNDVAAAAKKSADALENAISRHLTNTGASPDLVKNFREARELYAKTFTVEKSLNKGSGNIKAGKLAAEFDKDGGKKLTGDLKDIAKFAKTHPKASQELAGANPFSVIDAGVAGIGAVSNPGLIAYAGGRPVIRSMILNPTYQKMFVKGKAPSNTLTSVMRLGSKAATPLSALAGIKSQEDK